MVNFYYDDEGWIVTICDDCADDDLMLIDRAGTGDECCECGAQNQFEPDKDV
jgi:hypothetical protein